MTGLIDGRLENRFETYGVNRKKTIDACVSRACGVHQPNSILNEG
jgi:hypothetical protein